MSILRILRDIAINKKKILTKENEIMADVVNVKTAFDFASFYAKYKAWIWGGFWAVGTYFFTPVVNDAVNGLPALKNATDRVTIVEEDVKVIKSDISEIKKILTPPSQ